MRVLYVECRLKISRQLTTASNYTQVKIKFALFCKILVKFNALKQIIRAKTLTLSFAFSSPFSYEPSAQALCHTYKTGKKKMNLAKEITVQTLCLHRFVAVCTVFSLCYLFLANQQKESGTRAIKLDSIVSSNIDANDIISFADTIFHFYAQRAMCIYYWSII